MKFLYKIFSNYDGFTPRRIPERLKDGKFLLLGWKRYLDEVDRGAECWVYFHGKHSFENGVYVKGYVYAIDRDEGEVVLRVREWSFEHSLTTAEETHQISQVVATRYRQVFLWPSSWDLVPSCGPEACKERHCGQCATWVQIERLELGDYAPPARVKAENIVPAYWVIPRRCYVFSEQKRLTATTERISHVFGEFKMGERRYAFPLALGIFEALRDADTLDFDAIVPVPLSPDKAEAGELNRTLVLAQELGRLLGIPVRNFLSLKGPISKRRMLADGYSLAEFCANYRNLLVASAQVSQCDRVLLLDDVITRGATTECAVDCLMELKQNLGVVVTAAGQMIVKAAVRNEKGFLQQ